MESLCTWSEALRSCVPASTTCPQVTQIRGVAPGYIAHKQKASCVAVSFRQLVCHCDASALILSFVCASVRVTLGHRRSSWRWTERTGTKTGTTRALVSGPSVQDAHTRLRARKLPGRPWSSVLSPSRLGLEPTSVQYIQGTTANRSSSAQTTRRTLTSVSSAETTTT